MFISQIQHRKNWKSDHIYSWPKNYTNKQKYNHIYQPDLFLLWYYPVSSRNDTNLKSFYIIQNDCTTKLGNQELCMLYIIFFFFLLYIKTRPSKQSPCLKIATETISPRNPYLKDLNKLKQNSWHFRSIKVK